MSGLKVKNLLIKLQEKAIKKEFVDLSVIPPLKGDEVKKGLKILTLKKLLTILTILLAQIKAGNNSNKL